jgi:hypothetical protein
MKKYEVVFRGAVDFYYIVEAENEDDAVELVCESGPAGALCKRCVDVIVPSVREVKASNRPYDALKETEENEISDWLEGIDHPTQSECKH